MLPISLHSSWIDSPPLRRIAPATPARRMRSLFAALTMASTSMSVMSPCWMRMRSVKGFIVRFPAGMGSWFRVLRIILTVIIHATARLAFEAAYPHVLLEQRARNGGDAGAKRGDSLLHFHAMLLTSRCSFA